MGINDELKVERGLVTQEVYNRMLNTITSGEECSQLDIEDWAMGGGNLPELRAMAQKVVADNASAKVDDNTAIRILKLVEGCHCKFDELVDGIRAVFSLNVKIAKCEDESVRQGLLQERALANQTLTDKINKSNKEFVLRFAQAQNMYWGYKYNEKVAKNEPTEDVVSEGSCNRALVNIIKSLQ